MENEYKGRNKQVFLYTIFGVIFGLLFPIGATVIETMVRELSFTLENILKVHTDSHLLKIINTAPFFLGLFAYFAGVSKWKSEEANLKLNETLLSLERKVDERTKELVEKNKELYVLANCDPLTELPNRRSFIEHIDELVNRGDKSEKFAVLFIDLDRFKSVNDWYGHEIGDKLLMDVAQRLREETRDYDFISRLSGDEFTVVLKQLKNENEALNIGRNIVKAFEKPFFIQEKRITSNVSIGMSIYPINTVERTELLKFADIALYRSKEEGKNRCRLYNCKMKKETNRKLEIESKMFNAINENEFILYYQPQFDMNQNEITGFEALIRWHNRELGYISPIDFIPIAEENGAIINIGEWVIRNACREIKEYNVKHNVDYKVAINVSPKQFLTSNLLYTLQLAMKENELNGANVVLEITEQASIYNEDKFLEKLKQLKDLGVILSIDDFGTGYSSFSYLKNYPIDYLKIDIGFIRDIEKSVEDYNIVKAIISMAKNMNIKVIAEGVETESQMELLRRLGCEGIQGYYIGKPTQLEKALECLIHKKVL